MALETNTTFYYRCEAWQREDFEPEDNPDSPEEAVFLIEIYAKVNNLTRSKQFLVPQNHLSWSTITSMLSEMNVPLNAHPRTILEIQQCARSIMSEDENINRKTLPMVVTVTVTADTPQLSDEEFSGILRESFDSHVPRFIGATKSSIKALNKIKVEAESVQCVICLEEILNGEEATLMPCPHIYHPDCIAKWLNKNNACPLCRRILIS